MDGPKAEGGYWENRRLALLKQMERDEAKLNAKLAKVYEAEIAKLGREIASYYQRYGEKNVIEYRKLLVTLSDEDRTLLMERMEAFGKKYPQYAHLLPVRESIYKLNEMEGIQLSMRMQQLEIGAIEQEDLQKHLEKQALRSANLAAEQMGFGTAFYTVDASVIKATVGNAWAGGKAFSERIWGNREKLAAYLNDDFAKAVARGESYERIMREMGKRFENVSKRDMTRLVFTEGTFVFNEAHAQVHEQTFDHYTLSTASDKGVCSQCLGIEAQTRKEPVLFKDRSPGVNFPPLHPGCRCSYEVAVEDWDAWIEQQVAKGGGDSLSRASTKPSSSGNVRHMEQNESLVKTSKSPNSLSVSPVVNTKEYHDAFEAMPVSKKVAQKAYEQAGRILRKTDGTSFEHMVAINARTGKLVTDNLGRAAVERATGFTYEEATKVMACSDGVITIHNHPASKQPSYRDIITAARNEHVAASIVIGHDGSVWYMSIDDERIATVLERSYNENSNQWGERAEIRSVSDLLEENEARNLFVWRRLR